jgi:hypothetical protein
MPCCGAPILPRPFQCMCEVEAFRSNPTVALAWDAEAWIADGVAAAATERERQSSQMALSL